MVQHIFEIIILILLFREVLGYKELEKGIFVAAGIAIAVVLLLIKACFDVYDFNVWLQRFLLIVPSFVPLFIFKGRKGVIFGISFCTTWLLLEMTTLVFGAEMLITKGNLNSINEYIISGPICIVGLLLLRCYIRSENINLYSKINNINCLLFIPVVAILYITMQGGMYVGEVSNEEAAVINGINTYKRRCFRYPCCCAVCGAGGACLSEKRNEASYGV